MIARTITYTIIGLLAIFVLTTTFLLDGGGGKATPQNDSKVSVHDLSLDPEKYRGITVVTAGTLGLSQETKQYQIVDDGLAIVVTGYEKEALLALSGQRVSVTGKFDFDTGTGIFIDADTIRVDD